MDYHIVLSIFHIFIVSPLFLSVAFLRSNTPIWLYWIILVLGLIVLAYHTYKLLLRYFAKSSYVWVNAIHVFYVAPLMIYVGYKQKESLRYVYELMAIVGFGSLGYHTYSLVNNIKTLQTNEH